MGIELDPVLFKETELRIKAHELRENIILVNDNYTNIENIVREHNFRPNGILFDLGLSSWHYDRSGREFSFKRDEPLDMNYGHGQTQTKTAAEVLNTYSKEELEKIIREYGEEQFAESIVKNIIYARKREPILTTSGLVEVINGSVPHWYKKRKIHFATKTFQALRIEVNSELKNVENGVSSAINILETACPAFVPSTSSRGSALRGSGRGEQSRRGGRLAVISFQGLEDKIVRELFKKKVKEGVVRWVVKGTIKPTWEEVKANPRARSAKMKIVEKLNC